ncbi:hypothetical protein L873DRAFT_1843074 [Choiromyces venosus 120613-1]|uniref:Origin recognition complex subunit 1 n=1 Tax=Choiromyces venosus 120613-1 TaxID=1336337 RepID=A0A3N4JSR9_9PEZI|nr:hypothetical protein L873DRAFT_1843074 [Choiromyces venosus 120613-1]
MKETRRGYEDQWIEDDPNLGRRTKAPRISTSTRRTPGGVSKKYTTSMHKRIVVKKSLLFTPLSTHTLSPGTRLSIAHAVAQHRLHVSTLSPSVPSRNRVVHLHLRHSRDWKTATFRAVITQLPYSVTLEELDGFTFVELNGIKVTDPHRAYSLLWEAIKGDRVSHSQGLGLREPVFSTPSPRGVRCVVLADEPD